MPERVLILRNQGIGDLFLITPAIRALREKHPHAHISVMVGKWSHITLQANPYIDDIIAYPDAWIQSKNPFGFIKLIAKLRKKQFQIAYIFHSHPLIHMMAVLAGIKHRFGFYDSKAKKFGWFLTAKTEWQPNTDRYIADNYLDIPRLNGWQGNNLRLDLFFADEEQRKVDQLLAANHLEKGNYFVVAPGGGINPRQNVFAKRWSSENFTALCNLMIQQWDLKIVLTGSQQEIPIGKVISKSLPESVIDLTGKISFRETAGIVQRSRMLISNDSAIMHAAVALQVPSITIFGPSNPHSLLPVSDINRWITSKSDCSPCYCNSIFSNCEHLKCMTALSPDMVMNQVQKMMQL